MSALRDGDAFACLGTADHLSRTEKYEYLEVVTSTEVPRGMFIRVTIRDERLSLTVVFVLTSFGVLVQRRGEWGSSALQFLTTS